MFTRKMKIVLLLFVLFCLADNANATPRWRILDSGAIEWQIDGRLPHYDHIEMSGLKVSAVLRYGVNGDGQFVMERSMIWPMLRTIPNNTHASLMQRFAIDYASLLLVNGMALNNEKVKSICIDGRLTVVSLFAIGYQNTGTARNREPVPVVELTRSFFPSTDKPMLCERYTVKNISSKPISVIVPFQKAVYKTDPVKGVDGSYTIVTSIQNKEDCLYTIAPKESLTFDASVQAYKKGEKELIVDIADEEHKRMAFVDKIWNNLSFVSPDPVVNTAFAFAKVRAAESIFATGGGFMHSPGGESYYAAVWANDQAEYANPFFPFLGYDIGNASALNSFRLFARFMNSDYKPIPSSIIAEGKDTWNGAGDRGDEAKTGTVEALFSPRLWSKDGLLTQAGTDTFWDRSTLYALRGVYSAGARERAMEHMAYYSQQRLLGEHVPYPIEAWPEGNQRHLSAESALYCRIVTEGIFGIRPTGFNSFSLCPQLPDKWNSMRLNNVSAFAFSPFDIIVERQGNKIKTYVLRNGKPVKTYHTENGKDINITF